MYSTTISFEKRQHEGIWTTLSNVLLHMFKKMAYRYPSLHSCLLLVILLLPTYQALDINITDPGGGGNPLDTRCYTCRYASYKIPTHELINDPNCQKENPQLKLPCPFNMCSIWTFTLKIAGRSLESTGKVCVTPELKKCYETVTGVTLKDGQCKKVAKLSLEQLKILTSGDCGVKIPLKESRDAMDDGKGKPEGKDGTRSIYEGDFKLEDILKNDYNYEVCVCKGDLCNDYRKLKLNDDGSSVKSCMSILFLLLLAVYLSCN